MPQLILDWVVLCCCCYIYNGMRNILFAIHFVRFSLFPQIWVTHIIFRVCCIAIFAGGILLLYQCSGRRVDCHLFTFFVVSHVWVFSHWMYFIGYIFCFFYSEMDWLSRWREFIAHRHWRPLMKYLPSVITLFNYSVIRNSPKMLQRTIHGKEVYMLTQRYTSWLPIATIIR